MSILKNSDKSLAHSSLKCERDMEATRKEIKPFKITDYMVK